MSRRQCPGYSDQLVCQSTGYDKVTFPTQQLPDPIGQLARLVLQFLYEYPGTLNVAPLRGEHGSVAASIAFKIQLHLNAGVV